MKAHIINPQFGTIVEVDFDGTHAGLANLYPYERADVKQINDFGDQVMFQPEGAEEGEGHWHVFCAACNEPHVVKGMAVIFGTRDEDPDDLMDPAVSARGFREVVEWGKGETRDPQTALDRLAALAKLIEEITAQGKTH